MSGIWLASYLALWIFVVFEALLLFILFRELGVRLLHTAGGVSREGLAVGVPAPRLEVQDVLGHVEQLPNERGRPTLVVLGSHRCHICHTLAPHLNTFAEKHRKQFDIVFVTDEPPEAARETAQELGLRVKVVANRGIADAYKVRVTPFAFLISESGIVRAKGLVNNERSLGFLLESASNSVGRERSSKTTLQLE